MQEKVVVTGMGTVNPIGNNVKESWYSVTNAISGVGPVTLFDTSDFLVKIDCEVKNFDPEIYMPAKELRRRDRFQIFAAAAVKQALDQSGLSVENVPPERVGSIVSSSIGGLGSLVAAVVALNEEGVRRISPFTIPMAMANGAAGLVGIDHGFQGPSFSVASACASGADGLGIAWLMIRGGLIDAAIAGASDATLVPMCIGSFDRLGAMSRRNDDYSMTPQPFDLNRDGLVMGEGAAILILERESLARRRGAEILAELAGYGSTADAFHITAPSENGSGGARAIMQALDSAGVNLQEVDYINAHGTATELNDLSETRAIKTVFGEFAYNIPVSSTKSMTGHMIGATGALEAIFSILAIREGVIPPTAHYETPDPQCDLDYVPNQSRELPVKVVVSNAFGFGGHNAVLVLRKYT